MSKHSSLRKTDRNIDAVLTVLFVVVSVALFVDAMVRMNSDLNIPPIFAFPTLK